MFPEAREQRCWVHKIANVLDALPKRLQPRAKTMLHEIMEAPTRAETAAGLERFRTELDAKYPKAVTKLDKDWRALTAFYDFPAEHWRHLRTTNPIESSFATVKLRTRVTKGAGSKQAALSFKTELIADRVWPTRTSLELAIVGWVAWFNTDRLHGSLGDIPPAEFETLRPTCTFDLSLS